LPSHRAFAPMEELPIPARGPRRERTQRPLYLLLTLGLVIVVLSAGGGAWLRTTLAPATPSGSLAPDFTLQTTNNTTIQLRSLRSSVVLVEFFATWCIPCAVEVGTLAQLHRQYPQLTIITIGWDRGENASVLATYGRAHNMTWTIAPDTDWVGARYGVAGLPTMVLIDQQQRIVQTYTGLTTTQALTQDLAKLGI